MKVKFLASLCGGKRDYHPGDVANKPDAEALRLIDSGICEPAVKKEYAAVKEKIAEAERAEQERAQKLEAIMYENELKAEKEKLLKRISQIDAILGEKKEEE